MASETKDQEPAGGRKGKLMMLAVVAIGLLVGVGAGVFFVAPSFAARAEPAASAAVAEEEAPAEESSPSSAGGGSWKAMYSVENLVLNPANSGGTRFLMASVAFGLKDEAAATKLREGDAQVRDILLAVLGSKTVAELAEVSTRDSLKIEVRDSVATMLAPNSIQQVFFSQFVIQ